MGHLLVKQTKKKNRIQDFDEKSFPLYKILTWIQPTSASDGSRESAETRPEDARAPARWELFDIDGNQISTRHGSVD